jgi:hypothetical protein
LDKCDVIEVCIKWVVHARRSCVIFGLDTLLWRLDAACHEVVKKDPDWDDEHYFSEATKAINGGVIEAIETCLKKRMVVDKEVTLRCLNILASVMKGRSWDGFCLEERAHDFSKQIRTKAVACNLVNTVLLLLEKTVKAKGSQSILIEAFGVLSDVLSRDHLSTLSVNIDASKEFVIVEAMENQLAIEHHGLETYRLIKNGCMILEAFIRLHPGLRRNTTCRLIRKLLVEVYDVYYALPYHFIYAIAVLDVLWYKVVCCDIK